MNETPSGQASQLNARQLAALRNIGDRGELVRNNTLDGLETNLPIRPQTISVLCRRGLIAPVEDSAFDDRWVMTAEGRRVLALSTTTDDRREGE